MLDREALSAVGRGNLVGLLDQQPAQQDSPAGPRRACEGVGQLDKRSSENVGDVEFVGRAAGELWRLQAGRDDETAERAVAILLGLLAHDSYSPSTLFAPHHPPP